MPRLKDLPDQVLYRIDRGADYGRLAPAAPRHAIDLDLIVEQWDQLVRIAASLKDRTAPAACRHAAADQCRARPTGSPRRSRRLAAW